MTAPIVAETMARIAAGGPDAVEVCALLTAIDVRHWPDLFRHVFRARPPVEGWQTLLVGFWRQNSAGVVAAAGNDRDILERWFAYADLKNCRVPILEPYLAKEVPPVQILYRGAQGCPYEAALGYSWTRYPHEAFHYAYLRRLRLGKPVLIRRRVTANEIAMQFRSRSRETVLLRPAPFEVLSLTPSTLTRLRRAAEQAGEIDRRQPPLDVTEDEARHLLGIA